MKLVVAKTATYTLTSPAGSVTTGDATYVSGARPAMLADDVEVLGVGTKVSVTSVTVPSASNFVQTVPATATFLEGSEKVLVDGVGVLRDDATATVTVSGTTGVAPNTVPATISVTVSINDPGQSKVGEV